MSETLHALSLPLWGSRLIEASAGTGKTWTLAALVLRLVLGHGGTNGFVRPLLPAEILVMTFTRAATRELRDRIRERLLQAAQAFRSEGEPSDPLLADLRAAYAPGAARRLAAWRLDMAAQSMDDAAVHTIDAWCQRMLREHAFDSGCLFDEELNADERAQHDEAALDYWRQQVYPLTGATLDAVLAVWPQPDSLAHDTHELARHTLPAAAGQGSLGDCIAAVLAQRRVALARLKLGWATRAHEMQAWLDTQLASKSCGFNKNKLAQRHYTGWLQTLAHWSTDPDAEVLDLKTGLTRLTPAGLQDAAKPGHGVDAPPAFAAFEQLQQDLAAVPAVAPALRLHAAVNVAARLAELKSQTGSFGFADMLSRLDAALDPAVQGASAERLRQRILAQTPVALVDEFQDTSPVQARIFDRLYRVADNDPATGLLLIGDPKQAIYGFRGADIYSYLALRQATLGRHYVLGTNYRSTAGLVDAVNHLFAGAENRPGSGAFMFRSGGSGAANPLPFEAVKPQGRNEVLCSSHGPMPALQLVLDDTLQDASSSRRHFAARCAEEIVTLLNDPAAAFVQTGQAARRLQPADVAVLVRTGREAAAVRRELRRRQVASVYLSDKDSVFDSDEAHDLLRWLRAVASPRDVRLARAALATRTVGLSVAELLQLANDDEAFDARAEQLRGLQLIWQNQGVLAMLRQTLHLLGLPARWLGGQGGQGAAGIQNADGPADGERRLTNVLHLAELLQAASPQLQGEQALIRWLAAQTAGQGAAGDEQVVRLESDADLVKLITIHKSKGLEYPVVLLPFASSFRGRDKGNTHQVSRVDELGRRQLQLQPGPDDIAADDLERQREDLRLLYVALTRARHTLWVGLAALKVGPSTACTWQRSAVGHLLTPAPNDGKAVAPADLMALVRAAVQACPHITLQPAPAPDTLGCTRLLARGQAAPLLDLAPYAAHFDRRWTVGSFSGLVRDLAAPAGLQANSPLSAAAAHHDDPVEGEGDGIGKGAAALRSAGPQTDSALVAPGSPQPWHSFPRGALAGNFVHDQLEWLAHEGFALAESPELQAALQRRCDNQGYAARAPDLLAWLCEAIATPLPPVGATLRTLHRVLPEMEFWLPSAALVTVQVDSLCRQHILPGLARPALPERELRGMLMGFADLVFEHGGRYWVLDYKSNHLGPHDASYTPAALHAAMAEHRYDVQAALYLLALHRLLRARLGRAYRPDQHLGGAVYLFLRGIQGPARGCVWVGADPALLDGLDTMLGTADAAAEGKSA